MDGDHVGPADEVNGGASERNANPLGDADEVRGKAIKRDLTSGHGPPVNFGAVDPDDAAVVMADLEGECIWDLAGRDGE